MTTPRSLDDVASYTDVAKRGKNKGSGGVKNPSTATVKNSAIVSPGVLYDTDPTEALSGRPLC